MTILITFWALVESEFFWHPHLDIYLWHAGEELLVDLISFYRYVGTQAPPLFLLKSVCTAPSPWQFLYLPWILHWSGIFQFQVIKPLLRPEKTKQDKTLIYRQTDLPSRVGRSVGWFFFFFFFFSRSKNDTKNTKILKKKSDIFLQKNFGKIFWLIFKIF